MKQIFLHQSEVEIARLPCHGSPVIDCIGSVSHDVSCQRSSWTSKSELLRAQARSLKFSEGLGPRKVLGWPPESPKEMDQ